MRTLCGSGARVSRRSAGVLVMTMLAAAANGLAEPPADAGPGSAPTSAPAPGEGVPDSQPRPGEATVKLYTQQQKLRADVEKELKKLRATHFKSIRNPKIRAEGIAKLGEYNRPALYPSLIEIFQYEQDDVRAAVLDMFHQSATDEGDASLAWVAIEGEDPEFREMARSRLVDRVSAGQGASNRVRAVIMHGLKSPNDARVAASAELAQHLSLFETIPWLIQAQVGGTTSASGGISGDRQGALAWIMVGQQQAFVSDLQPVVGESAVGFDPQLSTLTTGTILRVMDAQVVTYRTEVNAALIGLSSRLTGRDTSGLGWNQPAWWRWYVDEGKGLIAQSQASAEASAEAK